jgi:hypothetical protein
MMPSKLDFASVRRVYATFPPLGFRETGPEYHNTCAVRLADAITRVVPDFFSDSSAATWPDPHPTGRYVSGRDSAVGVQFQTAPQNRKLPIRANELAAALDLKLGTAQAVYTKSQIVSQLGIVFFDGIPGYAGSGHISLWDGQGVADRHEYWDSRHIRFWSL